jgi:predicted lysophospholipase L1 biosynthesis ABC-type transport system permease subunit
LQFHRGRFGDRVITPRRRTVLLGLLGGLGLLLALVGIFGMTAYAVARRTQEIGVRMAFGARPVQVVGTMIRDALWPVAIGIVVGLVGAAFATRVIVSFLFETRPIEPLTFAMVAAPDRLVEAAADAARGTGRSRRVAARRVSYARALIGSHSLYHGGSRPAARGEEP